MKIIIVDLHVRGYLINRTLIACNVECVLIYSDKIKNNVTFNSGEVLLSNICQNFQVGFVGRFTYYFPQFRNLSDSLRAEVDI